MNLPDTSTGTMASADARAREVEERMTDDERFALLISVAGSSTVAASDTPGTGGGRVSCVAIFATLVTGHRPAEPALRTR